MCFTITNTHYPCQNAIVNFSAHSQRFFTAKYSSNMVTVMPLNSSPCPHTHSIWLWFPDDSCGECVLTAGRVLCASYKEEH